MPLSITVLGSSGTFASPGNACSGYLVDADGFRVLLDCGPGTVANLQAHLRLAEVDAVVVSHVHPDHWLDLPVLRNAYRYVLGRSDVPVLTTAEVMEQADLLIGLDDPTLRWSVLEDGDERRVGPLRLRVSRTAHPAETLAVRLDLGDASLAYSADTGPSWTFAELGRGIDVAVGEATVLHADHHLVGDVHSSAQEAGAGAAAAGVERLVLTHLLPGADPGEFRAEAAAAYGAPVQVAAVGATFHC